MKKETKLIVWSKVILVKNKYGLTFEKMAKILGVSPSLIGWWIRKPTRTNLKTYNKFDFLYTHFNSKFKFVIKLIARYIIR